MNKKLLSATFLILFCFVLKAQPFPKKEHFRILNPNMEATLGYEKAMVHADLDSLRFISKRRQIPCDGTSIIIELYSADELWSRYQKPISPLNIKDPQMCRKVKVKLAQAPYYLTVVPLTNK